MQEQLAARAAAAASPAPTVRHAGRRHVQQQPAPAPVPVTLTLPSGGTAVFRSEAWHLPAAAATPQLRCLVLGGNPSYAVFYTHFMQHLHARFGGAADILAASHVGHDDRRLSGRARFGLDCQVQHKVALLQHMLAPGGPPLVVVAHSIGAWMALRAIAQLEEEQGAPLQQLRKVVLMMPFLSADWSSPEVLALALAARHAARPLAAAAGWLGAGPAWLQDGVVRLAGGAEPHASAGLRGMMSEGGLGNALHLAQHEFDRLDAPVDWQPLARLGRGRAAVIHNPDDPWSSGVSSSSRSPGGLQAALPGFEEYAEPRLSHAFCLSERECELAAALVHEAVSGRGAAAGALGEARRQRQRAVPEAASG